MIVIDVETSGIDPNKSSIVSIGAVDFENPGNTFYGECKVFDEAEIHPKALEVNGFTLNQLTDKNKKSDSELIKSFFSWIASINDKTIASHNIWFDYSFLKSTAERAGITIQFGYRCVDLHSIAFNHFAKSNLKIPLKNNSSHLTSEFIFNYVGLTNEPVPHNALTGAKMAAESFSRLIHGKNLLQEFKNHRIPKILKTL